ncbi:hypothetical protein DPX16_20719 [Anabarilius grahami]|uniref:Uncharacterized protein n=1 Tax=Anabarilius grahami TaxID=495550 RepID=A0A3N0YF42_ANAGA|nr:hypothetical protein DPX16_20719 [Anabarilius grahami]
MFYVRTPTHYWPAPESASHACIVRLTCAAHEPEQGLTSPHNEAVTTYLLGAMSASPDLHDADNDDIVSACKTYYETVRRSFRYKHPDLASQAEAVKRSARSRARRKRLLEARQSVLAEDEVGLWKCATIDLMSDEEDGIVGGVSGWIVRPPSFRSQELTELCATLQLRLVAILKYRATHHRLLQNGLNSDRMPLVTYSPEAENRHCMVLQDFGLLPSTMPATQPLLSPITPSALHQPPLSGVTTPGACCEPASGDEDPAAPPPASDPIVTPRLIVLTPPPLLLPPLSTSETIKLLAPLDSLGPSTPPGSDIGMTSPRTYSFHALRPSTPYGSGGLETLTTLAPPSSNAAVSLCPGCGLEHHLDSPAQGTSLVFTTIGTSLDFTTFCTSLDFTLCQPSPGLSPPSATTSFHLTARGRAFPGGGDMLHVHSILDLCCAFSRH